MTNRRNKLLKKLIGTAIGEDEKKLYQLTIERVCADMCDFYTKFYIMMVQVQWYMFRFTKMKINLCFI